MARLTSLVNANGDSHYLDEAKATAVFDLGDTYEEAGNVYMYVLASEDLSRGALLAKTAVVDVDTVADGTGTATYDGRVYGFLAQVTEGAAGWTAGAYKNYCMIVNDGTGVGQVGIVDNNSTDTLYLKEPLTTALDVADSDILIFHPQSVRETDASTKEAVCGIAPRDIDQSVAAYFWAQIDGVAAILIGADASSSAGIHAVSGAGTAGAAAIAANGNDLFDVNLVGTIIAGSDTADTLCWVQLNLR